MWVQSVGGEHTLEQETATRSRILAWEIRGVWQASPRGHKESDMTEHTAQAHRVLGKEKLELGPYHYVDVNTLSIFFFFYWSEFPFPSPGIFLTQGSNPGLLNCRQTLYCLSHQGITLSF